MSRQCCLSIELDQGFGTDKDKKKLCYYVDYDVKEDVELVEYLGRLGLEPKIHTLKKACKDDIKNIIEKEVTDHFLSRQHLEVSKQRYQKEKDKLEKDKVRLEEEIEKFQKRKMKFIKERDSYESDSDSDKPKKKK